MNDDLEMQLRAALARKEPPPGFAGRTMARVERPPRAGANRWVSFALAAALLLSFGVAGVHRARQRQQVRADEAKQQLMLALRITSAKLAVVDKVLERSTN